MSMYLAVDAGEPEFVASNQGWGDVVRWAETLDLDNYAALVSLCEHGISEAPNDVREQVEAACVDEKVEENVRAVLETMQAILASNDNAEVIVVTDGMAVEETPAQTEDTTAATPTP